MAMLCAGWPLPSSRGSTDGNRGAGRLYELIEIVLVCVQLRSVAVRRLTGGIGANLQRGLVPTGT